MRLPLLAASVALLLTVEPAAGQADRPCRIGARAGPVFPAGELAEVVDPDLSAGIRGRCSVGRRFAIGLGVETALYSFFADSGSEADLFHLLAGVGLEVVEVESPRGSPSLTARIEGGWTWTSTTSEEILLPGAIDRISLLEGGPTVGAGLRGGIGLSDRISVFLDGAWRLVFVDTEDRVERIPGRDPVTVEGFDAVSSFPLAVGFEVSL